MGTGVRGVRGVRGGTKEGPATLMATTLLAIAAVGTVGGPTKVGATDRAVLSITTEVAVRSAAGTHLGGEGGGGAVQVNSTIPIMVGAKFGLYHNT